MDLFYWDKFKKRYEMFAYIFVYVGYFIHLLNLFENTDILLYVIIGYFLCFIFMYQAFFNPVIILLHSCIFLYYIDYFYPKFEHKILSFLFFLPFYSVVIYFILSLFGIDGIIARYFTKKNRIKTENNKMKK